MQTVLSNKIVFLHLPKTGGTTLFRLLAPHIPDSLTCSERFNGLNEYSVEELSRYQLFAGHFDYGSIARIPGEKFLLTILREPKSRVLSLYYYWKSHKWSYLEKHGLRGPQAAKRLSLREFLRWSGDGVPESIDNAMVRNLLGRLWCGPGREFLVPADEVVSVAWEHLQAFNYVGFCHDLDKHARELLPMVGMPVPDQVPRLNSISCASRNYPHFECVEPEEQTQEVDDMLDELTRFDQLLYDKALEHFDVP